MSKIGLVVLAVLFLPRLSSALEEKTETEKESWLPILKRHAADYAIVPREGGKVAPTPLPEPILRWTQPVRGGDDGAVFLWVTDGRPAAVGTIFTYRVSGSPRVLQHEVHSLLTGGLDATWRGRPAWRSEKPGLTFRPVPDAPAPAGSAPSRLRQMQAIAREFSAGNVHEKAGVNELRLMPHPLYRYDPAPPGPGSSWNDGALFCFAHGTDPEVFLLLETRRDGEKTEWHYALARFSDLALRVRFKGHEVWNVPPGTWNSHDGVHAYYLVEQINADTPEQYRKAAEAGATTILLPK